jgi:hypothetical protein
MDLGFYGGVFLGKSGMLGGERGGREERSFFNEKCCPRQVPGSGDDS